jgi:hypothetical protein
MEQCGVGELAESLVSGSSSGVGQIRIAVQLDLQTLCFSAAGLAPSKAAVTRKKVEQEQVTKALTDVPMRSSCHIGVPHWRAGFG